MEKECKQNFNFELKYQVSIRHLRGYSYWWWVKIWLEIGAVKDSVGYLCVGEDELPEAPQGDQGHLKGNKGHVDLKDVNEQNRNTNK